MSAAKIFSIREITDVNEFKEKAFPIYLSFYQRTEYKYKKERLNQYWFSGWAEAVFRFGKFLILGACRNGQLEAVWTAQLVEDTVFSTTAFSHAEALHLNVNSLLFHSLREVVASSGQAKQIFVGMYKYGAGRGVDDFYLSRGCSLVQMPAALRVHPPLMALIRAFLPREHRRLAGAIDRASNPMAGLTDKPAGPLKQGQSAGASAEGQPGSSL